MIEPILVLAFGYILGSIPFGLVLCRVFGYGDIRKIGSGNIGATNVLRTGNKALALATLILDSGKGAIAVGFVFLFFPENMTYLSLTALGAIIGHCYPMWLGFKGGKGVATTFGSLLAAMPFAGLIACGAWLISAFAFRISSLSALIAITLVPLSAYVFYGLFPSIIGFMIAALVFWRHRDNIQRLAKGEEPKIGRKKKT